MKHRTSAYILVKDGTYYSFTSEKGACDFLGVSGGRLSTALYDGQHIIQGYEIIKAISEQEIYANKRLRKIWGSMKERCYREKHMHYDNYGGRGITVCDEWKDNYISFARWAYNNGYQDGLSIDRIDNNGNYEPSNCRWATDKEQNNNTRNNRIVEYQGKQYTVSQLAEFAGLSVSTIFQRIYKGWDINDVVQKPLRERKRGYRPSKAYNCEVPG